MCINLYETSHSFFLYILRPMEKYNNGFNSLLMVD